MDTVAPNPRPPAPKRGDPDKPPEDDSGQSSQGAQIVFVGVLLLVVLTVIAIYLLGDFRGLNPGADFGLVLSITLAIGIAVGLLLAYLHDRR